MKIDISDLLSIENLMTEQQCEAEFSSFQSKMGEFPVVVKQPFTLCFENKEGHSLLISGETDITLAIPCDRCLQDVFVTLHLLFDRKFPLEDGALKEAFDAEDTSGLIGTELDTDRLIYNEVLVNWPEKVLCQKDCKGICRTCGVNLNEKTCSCGQTELDPRMAAIQDIFHQFKEV